MRIERSLTSQRNDVNRSYLLFVVVVAAMWLATLLDHVFRLGWGWDREILWAAPPMLLFATVLRILCMAIFALFEGSSSSS